MNVKFKKIILYIAAVLPAVIFLLIPYINNFISPFLITVFLTCYIVVWIFFTVYISKKIQKYNFYLLTSSVIKVVKDIKGNDFLQSCENIFIENGFEKNVDIYEDGETLITATCFYKNTKNLSGNSEGQIAIFLSGVKSFYDLINTESNLNDSILNCSDQDANYSSLAQTVCIVFPYPEEEIYNFCSKNFYSPKDSVLFVACNTDIGKAYYSLPSKIKNKSFAKSVELVENYITVK